MAGMKGFYFIADGPSSAKPDDPASSARPQRAQTARQRAGSAPADDPVRAARTGTEICRKSKRKCG